MNKRLSIILVVLSMLIVLVGGAAAPKAAAAVRLVSVEYVPHKGPVFTFEVSGNFSRSRLQGTVRVQGGESYILYCTQVDDNTVKCNGSQKVGDVNVSVTFGGSTFWTYVPGAPAPDPVIEYCYPIYDYDMGFAWQSFGTHCQNIPAEYEDVITYFNPVWAEDYDVVFMPEGPVCAGIFGDAYYYPMCEYLEIPN